MKCLLLVVLGTILSARGDVPDQFSGLQTEFLLPYSETEDVDFHLNMPLAHGCWQWTTESPEAIALDPNHKDTKRKCGSQLNFRILPKMVSERKTFTIVAENIDLDGYDLDIPMMIEHQITVAPVHRLEISALKTEMIAGGEPAPFGVAGFDAEGNEFDTLDGLQISWYIGGSRDIAQFDRKLTYGPTTKVIPTRNGKGSVIAILTDPNYSEVIAPAVVEFTITSPLYIEPDGAYILAGAAVDMKLFEDAVENGETKLAEISLSGDDPEFRLSVRENDDVISLSGTTVTGLSEGESTLFVKNREGEIVKWTPVRVTEASRLTVTADPHPESKELVVGTNYTMKVNIFNEDDRPIYPSDNILCKITLPKQFKVFEMAESGLSAFVNITDVGLGKVKANLRSVLTPDDEEIEIVPHIKGSIDFALYEPVTLEPLETILPYDSNMKTEYDMKYVVKGGGQVYHYSISNESLATVSQDGKVSTHGGPGMFTVTAAMAQSRHIYAQSKVYLLPVEHLDIGQSQLEYAVGQDVAIPVRLIAQPPDQETQRIFTDCSDVPYEVILSDNKNFEFVGKISRGHHHAPFSCSTANIVGRVPGLSCKVTISYTVPDTGRTVQDSTYISTFRNLHSTFPASTNSMRPGVFVMPLGASLHARFEGGPYPWILKPSSHFKTIKVGEGDENIVKIEEVELVPKSKEEYVDIHTYKVTCLDVGKAQLELKVGNHQSKTNMNGMYEMFFIDVVCTLPAKITLRPEVSKGAKLPRDHKSGRTVVPNDQEIRVYANVKDEKGLNFMNSSTISFDVDVSDSSLLAFTDSPLTTESVDEVVPFESKPFKVFRPTGQTGPVTVTMSVAGYDEDKIRASGAKMPPPIQKEEEDEDYDEEEFDYLSETVEFKIVSREEFSRLQSTK